MNRSHLLKTVGVCAFVWISSVSVTAGNGTVDGLVVTVAHENPALARFSEEQLVDQLVKAEPSHSVPDQMPSRFWAISGAVDLGGGSIPLWIDSPAAVELVRRGLRAVPVLLNHLTDARPTGLVYVVRGKTAPGDSPLAFSDDYDPRSRGVVPTGVNREERRPLAEGGTCTFKVGDLCYATLGQIVNRDLRAVRSRAEDVMIFSGSFTANPGDWFTTLNSPVERPELAAAARAEWSGLDAAQHADSLRADIRKPTNKEPQDTGALVRLLYYYPDPGLDSAVALLQRRLENTSYKSGVQPEGTVTFWYQESFVKTLAPFHAERLQVSLLELFREAAASAEADVKTQPAGTWNPARPSLGSSLALECARRLIHEGHDDELKAFFSARVAAIEAARNSGDGPMSGPGFVNRIQAQACRDFLAELDRPAGPPNAPPPGAVPLVARANFPAKLGPVTLARKGSLLNVAVEPIDPGLDRILVGRIVIDLAKDDIGATLWPEHTPALAPVAVGRTSDEILTGLEKPVFEAELTRPAPRAKQLKLLEGRIEMVVPDLDPNAVVVVKDILAKAGLPFDRPELHAVGLSIALKIDKGNVTLSMSDPQERFLNVEFRDAAGKSLRYDHNGWSHSRDGVHRFDSYHLGNEVPPGTQMVVWLKTDKSFLSVPLKAVDLALPAATHG